MEKLLNKNLQTQRNQVSEIVKQLHDLTVQIGHKELAQTVSDLRNRIDEPFMFVIAGEVKVGKSSFINALLSTGKEICKVAPHPMTDTIQQIIYGEQEETIEINPYLKKIFQPVDILKEIAIVDTPGTNTIVEHHQEITERFIPAADLIVFVFESKNPYRQSAWDFFDYIHKDWHKKIIFVLQQKDLMPANDLATNIQGVKDYADKKGIAAASVFAVSAKQELEGQLEESGFRQIKQYIYDNITGGKAPVLKLHNNIATSRNINQRIFKGVQLRKEQWEADIAFRAEIKETLDKQAQKSNHQVATLVENLQAGYDRITNKTENELNDGLSFFTLVKRSISSIFSKQASAKDWLNGVAKNLETGLELELKNKLNDGVIDIADSIQQMGKMIDLKLQSSQNILKNNHDIFSDIAERRANVLRDLQQAFSKFLSRSENFQDEELFPTDNTISPNLATGSGIAIVGALLTGLTNGAVFDITGGILTAVGLVFAGVSIGYQRRKIMKGYREEIAKGREELTFEVTTKLNNYIDKIKERIDNNFDEFDGLLNEEEKTIQSLENNHQSIEKQLKGIEQQIS